MDLAKFKILRFLLPVFLLLGMMSCEEEEEVQTELSRMFMPTGDIKATGGETQVRLVWQAALYSNEQATYTVEVATDTLFQTPIVVTTTTDTSAVTLTDEQLQIKQQYYARVKTNALGNVPESKWVVSSRFSISGEQIFQPIIPSEVKDKTATLRWRVISGLTKITLRTAADVMTEIALTAAEAAAGEKVVSGLTPETTYTAEIFAGTKAKGITTFTTKPLSRFTVTLTPSDDLQAAIASAANNDVIGLEAGTYNLTSALIITGKQVTIQSISGTPSNTKVNFKEITLEGAGAGVKVVGIEFDGAASAASYFINLVGSTQTNSAPATFNSITVDNCIIRNTAYCFIRGDRGANAGDHKIGSITVTNTIAGETPSTTTYVYFTLPKLEFGELRLENSTFHNFGRTFISAGNPVSRKPTIFINNCTIANFGGGGATRNYLLLDANTNPIDFTLQNSIIGRSPMAGQVIGTSALRAEGTGSSITIRNNNMFKLTNGASPAVELSFPAYATPAAQKSIELTNWTNTNFAVPANSELRTSSTTGGPIGDPRWLL